ncbi:urokinase plasminogen activator surface receptor-like [Pseudophryne corroboree]|uniref:urokinase plasminogen activator surface receptor-like n=1 Tax=Pseudophryne corroboree TaxID=495146 RepID=UPI003081385F
MATVWRVLLVWFNISQVLSLKCAQCIGSSSHCGLVARTCPSYETTCLSLAFSTSDGSNTVMKGCSRTDICNQTSVINTGNHSIYMSSTCCETNYCNLNRYSTNSVFSNRLVCNRCQNPNQTCTTASNLQPMFCDEVSNNCVDVITQDFINGTARPLSYTKGCGSATLGNIACTNLFAYDTGSRQRYTYMSCCNGNNLCNSAPLTIPIRNNHNGDTCYGCYDTGNNECADANLVPVKCKGILIRCMEAFDQNRRTLFKGCSTVAFCSSTYPSLQVPNISEIQCCAGSYCNNFTQQTSTPAVPISSATSITRDFGLLVLFISLIYATVRHIS